MAGGEENASMSVPCPFPVPAKTAKSLKLLKIKTVSEFTHRGAQKITAVRRHHYKAAAMVHTAAG